MEKKRQLNMELLRIFSIALVLLCHTLFLSNGYPDRSWIVKSPFGTFMYVYLQALTVICVNCFILISGYFGLRLSLKGSVKILFIVLFYHLTIYGVIISLGLEPFSLKQLIKLLNPFGMEWFVSAYIGLMIFSPILNAFVEKVPRKTFKTVLIIYLGFQCSFGYLLPNPTGFDFVRGYSALAFVGLYLFGRYYRMYLENSLSQKAKRRGLSIYLLMLLIPTVAYYVTDFFISDSPYFPNMNDFLINLTSPFVVLGSFAMLIYFSSLTVNRHYKAIMFISSSVFSVYIIHIKCYVFPYYSKVSHLIISDLWPLAWIPVIILYVCAVFMACVLLDKIRIFIYDRLQPILPA